MSKTPQKKQLHKYLELTGVAFQMGITIYLGVYFGKWLDSYFQTNSKIFTIIITLLALIVSIVSVIVQLNKINDKYD